MTNKHFFCTILLSCAIGAHSQIAIRNSGPPAISDAELKAKLESALQQTTAKDEFSGVVLVARNGEPVFAKAYGMASKEYEVANNLDTKFNLGSIDKIFTKIAIGQLIADGKIASIDDKLGKYLPDYPNQDAAEKVTLRQIVNMRSGIGDFFGPKFMESAKDKYRTIADYLPLFAGERLAFEPGSKRQYSNGGYIVLGAVIEKVSGMSYYDYVRQHIFKPLGMNDTDFYEADVPTLNLASGYTLATAPDGGSRRNNFYTRPERGSSAGGGYSTARDLLRFSLALASGKIQNPAFDLSPASGNQFRSPPGIAVAGGAPGINADLETGLPGGYDLIVLSNYDPPSAESCAKQIRGILGLDED